MGLDSSRPGQPPKLLIGPLRGRSLIERRDGEGENRTSIWEPFKEMVGQALERLEPAEGLDMRRIEEAGPRSRPDVAFVDVFRQYREVIVESGDGDGGLACPESCVDPNHNWMVEPSPSVDEGVRKVPFIE